MANEIKDIRFKKNAEALKGFVKTVNNKALDASEELVDGGLKAAEKWQKVAAKALNTGVYLFGKQQELFFYTLEGVKSHSATGASRLKKLLNIEPPKSPKATRLLKKKEVAEVAKVSKSAAQKVAKTAETVRKGAVKAAAKATEIADQKIARQKANKAAMAPQKEDLKVIDGIGPKMETVLNKAGIVSYAQLANADAKALKNILLETSPRYKMFEPQEWITKAQDLLKK